MDLPEEVSELYEPCPLRHLHASRCYHDCPSCQGAGYVKTGLTSGQVEMYLRRHDRLRAALVLCRDRLVSIRQAIGEYTHPSDVDAMNYIDAALKACPPARTP